MNKSIVLLLCASLSFCQYSPAMAHQKKPLIKAIIYTGGCFDAKQKSKYVLRCV